MSGRKRQCNQRERREGRRLIVGEQRRTGEGVGIPEREVTCKPLFPHRRQPGDELSDGVADQGVPWLLLRRSAVPGRDVAEDVAADQALVTEENTAPQHDEHNRDAQQKQRRPHPQAPEPVDGQGPFPPRGRREVSGSRKVA